MIAIEHGWILLGNSSLYLVYFHIEPYGTTSEKINDARKQFVDLSDRLIESERGLKPKKDRLETEHRASIKFEPAKAQLETAKAEFDLMKTDLEERSSTTQILWKGNLYSFDQVLEWMLWPTI